LVIGSKYSLHHYPLAL